MKTLFRLTRRFPRLAVFAALFALVTAIAFLHAATVSGDGAESGKIKENGDTAENEEAEPPAERAGIVPVDLLYRVNGHPVFLAELARDLMRSMPDESRGVNTTLIRDNVVAALISDLGVEIPEEVVKRRVVPVVVRIKDEILSRYETIGEWEKKSGTSLDRFKELVAAKLRNDLPFEAVVAYDGVRFGRYRIRMFLAADREKAEEIAYLLAKGTPWEDYAEFSDDAVVRENKCDLGIVPGNRFEHFFASQPEMGALAAGAAPGEITGPVETLGAWALFLKEELLAPASGSFQDNSRTVFELIAQGEITDQELNIATSSLIKKAEVANRFRGIERIEPDLAMAPGTDGSGARDVCFTVDGRPIYLADFIRVFNIEYPTETLSASHALIRKIRLSQMAAVLDLGLDDEELNAKLAECLAALEEEARLTSGNPELALAEFVEAAEGDYDEYVADKRAELNELELVKRLIGWEIARYGRWDAYAIIAADEETAERLIVKLKSGEKFADLAPQYSIDPNLAEFGGKVGPYIGNSIDCYFDTQPVLARAIKEAPAGSLSEPLRVRGGYAVYRKKVLSAPLEVGEDALMEVAIEIGEKREYTRWEQRLFLKQLVDKAELTDKFILD